MCSFLFIAIFILFTGEALSRNSAVAADEGMRITGGRLTLMFDSNGVLNTVIDPLTGKDYAHKDRRCLVSLVLDGKVITPDAFKYDVEGANSVSNSIFRISYSFSQGVIVRLKAVSHNKYISFEVTDIRNTSGKDLKYLIWGPIPVAIKEKMAETLGVAYTSEYAIGLMALNVKTVAGRPDDVSNLVATDNWAPLRTSETWAPAMSIRDGVMLRAYCQDFTITRVQNQPMQYGGMIENLNVYALPDDEHYGADREIKGSRIAIYGCATSDVLDVTGEIEVAESLPHPITNGVWDKAPFGRINNNLRSMYLGHTFNDSTLDVRMEQTRRLGADMFFAYNCFVDYNGDYRLPNYSSYKDFASRYAYYAHAMDVLLGTKDRPPFITVSSPVVHGAANVSRNVLKANTATLTDAIEADDTIAFHPFEGTLTVVEKGYLLIGESEVATGVIEGGKLRLTSRGLQGTVPQRHPRGAQVSSLVNFQSWGDNFVPSLAYYSGDLMALAEWCNKGGFSIADMDGLEKCLDNGYGQYLWNKIVALWYNALDNKEHIKWNGSGLTQWAWHVAYPMQWGERSGNIMSEYDYRIGKNYDYFHRNFLTPSLGMNGFGKDLTRQQAHYAGSKVAAFNSQLGVSDGTRIDIASDTYSEGISASPIANELFDILREWTVARDMCAFTEEQRARMAPQGTQFRLSVTEPSIEWKLESLDSLGAITRTETVRDPNAVNYAATAKFTGSVAIRNKSEINNRSVQTGAEFMATVGSGAQYVTIDLGEAKDIDRLRFWHDFEAGKRYNDVVVMLSNDRKFRSRTIVYNNDNDNSLGFGIGDDRVYAETFTGKTVELPATVRARYVRLYSNGWQLIRKAGITSGDDNAYAEIQVIGGKRTVSEPL